MIGTAGWSIPRRHAGSFGEEGTHLYRYARVLKCAEINTSFYRPHAVDTYRKWAALAPVGFRFSVKLPSVITHEQELRRARDPLRGFLSEVNGLGRKLGPVLIQLPPSLEFNSRVARNFFTVLRDEFDGTVVCEPRHASWFEAHTDELLSRYRIGRVATDPTRIEAARYPGGWPGIAYFRLHGSPRKYWSSYERSRLESWAGEISRLPTSTKVWCIFDNTASGAALGNALELEELLSEVTKRLKFASS
jgi:uncharacterized protein YecE (DUF72 family)